MAHTATAPTSFQPVTWVRNVIAGAKDALHRRKIYNDVYGELSRLSNRDLDDLGLSRSQFHAIASDAAQNA